MTRSLITVLVADRRIHIDKDGIHGSVIAFLQNVINVRTFVCTAHYPHSFPSPMLSRYCCVITFNLPNPRFSFCCLQSRNSRRFPVAYEHLILLPGKERQLLSFLHCLLVDREWTSAHSHVSTCLLANNGPRVFSRFPSQNGPVFPWIQLRVLC